MQVNKVLRLFLEKGGLDRLTQLLDSDQLRGPVMGVFEALIMIDEQMMSPSDIPASPASPSSPGKDFSCTIFLSIFCFLSLSLLILTWHIKSISHHSHANTQIIYSLPLAFSLPLSRSLSLSLTLSPSFSPFTFPFM